MCHPRFNGVSLANRTSSEALRAQALFDASAQPLRCITTRSRPKSFKCFSQSSTAVVPCPRNKHIFRCDQNGPPAGRISRAIRNRSRSRGTAVGPFSSQPPGPRSVGRFSVPRLRDSLLTYRFRYARRSRLEKQPTDPATAGRKACLFRGQDTRSGQRAEVRSVASLSLSSLPG